MLYLIVFIIVVALAFDFLNGFHDAANSIATIVSTRVLTPLQAVIWAAFFNFVAAFAFGTPVAKTVGKGLIELNAINQYVVLGGLLGAITWNIITWLLGLPTSSSHALLSGYAGAAVAHSGFQAIIPRGWVPILLFLVLSPTIGFVLGYFNLVAVSWASALRANGEPAGKAAAVASTASARIAPRERQMHILPRIERASKITG